MEISRGDPYSPDSKKNIFQMNFMSAGRNEQCISAALVNHRKGKFLLGLAGGLETADAILLKGALEKCFCGQFETWKEGLRTEESGSL